MATKRPNRSNTFASKVQKLLDQGRTPKEIAKILKCEPSKVYNAKWYLNKKSGIAALPAKKSVVPKVEPARVVFTPAPEAKPVPSPYEESAKSTTTQLVMALAVTAVIAVLVAVFA